MQQGLIELRFIWSGWPTRLVLALVFGFFGAAILAGTMGTMDHEEIKFGSKMMGMLFGGGVVVAILILEGFAWMIRSPLHPPRKKDVKCLRNSRWDGLFRFTLTCIHDKGLV